MLAVRAYELMVIVDSDVADAEVSGLIETWTGTVESNGGQVATLDNWGRRRFAYEINHKWEGTYVVLEIVTTASDLSPLDRQLRLADQVVRHKILRLPEAEAERRGLLGESATPATSG